jgi:hypothetical protein
MAVPADARSLVLLFTAGFLVFGPFPSFTVLGAELLGPRSVGAGVGFMNGVGYGMAALGDVVTGAVIDARVGRRRLPVAASRASWAVARPRRRCCPAAVEVSTVLRYARSPLSDAPSPSSLARADMTPRS